MSDRPQSITVTSHVLGLSPYVLIELRAASDGSGDPALLVESGGGAEEQPFYLPLAMISEGEPETSPVAEMLRRLARSGKYDRGTLWAVVREFNPDWEEWVFRP